MGEEKKYDIEFHIIIPGEKFKINNEFTVLYIIQRNKCEFYRIVDGKNDGILYKTGDISDDIVECKYSYNKSGNYTISLLLYDDARNIILSESSSFMIYKDNYENLIKMLYIFLGFFITMVTFVFQQRYDKAVKKKYIKNLYLYVFLFLKEQLDKGASTLKLPDNYNMIFNAENIVHIPRKIKHCSLINIGMMIEKTNKNYAVNIQELKDEIDRMIKAFG